MKGTILSVLLTLCCCSAVAAGDLNQAFLDLPWGSAPAPGMMSKVASTAPIDYYAASEKVFHIGDSIMTDILYAYYEDRLFAVHLKIDSLDAFEKIKAYMRDRYGFPKTTFATGGDQTIFRWKHKRIRMKLKQYTPADAMKLSFYFAPVADRVNHELGPKAEPSVRFLPIERDKKPKALPLLVF